MIDSRNLSDDNFGLSGKDLAYVRIQDDLHGMHADSQGNLVLGCLRDAERNTSHWCAKGPVSDHAHGKFNLNSDGTLKGKIAIIASPGEMPVPRALNQVDTWFLMDARQKPDGTFERSLTVGRATVIAPLGTPVPAGVNAVFYDGTLAGRNNAISQELVDRNVQEQKIGMRSWEGHDALSSQNWATTTAKALYPKEYESIRNGLHDASPDDKLDTASIKRIVDDYAIKQDRLHLNSDGSETEKIDYIKNLHAERKGYIDHFFKTANPVDIARAGSFYTDLSRKLDADLSRAVEVSSLLQQQAMLSNHITDQVWDLCKERKEIHLAAAGSAQSVMLSPAQLTELLLQKKVPVDARIWIAGVTADWQPVLNSPLQHLLRQTADPAMLPPSLPMPLNSPGSSPSLPRAMAPIQLEPLRRNVYPEPDRAAVQEAVANAVETNPGYFVDAYVADERSFGGRYIAADLFKETFAEYRASKEARNRLNNPLHNSAAVLSSALFRQQLGNSDSPNEQDTVIFLTGIPGAGKTSSIVADKELPAHVRCVFEGQLSNPATTFEKIQQVLDAGLKPVIMAVHARPEDALQNTFRRFKEHGRGASINVMASIQGGLPDCLKAVQEKFGDKVILQVNDYRDRSRPQIKQGWENLSTLQSEGTHDQIRNRLSGALRLYESTGIISTACYRQASGLPPIDNGPKDGELQQEDDGECAENAHGREFSPAGG